MSSLVSKGEIQEAECVTMKSGKPTIQGVYPICGTRMFGIGKG
jgi:hypothetical protein